MFLSADPSRAFNSFYHETWKTLSDRFKKVFSDHRDAVRRNISASGIIEVRGALEELLNDIMLAIDKNEKQRRTEHDNRTELDGRLRNVGANIQEMDSAMHRRRSSENRTGQNRG